MGHQPSKSHGHQKTSGSYSSPTKSPGLIARRSEPANQIQKCDLSNFAVITVIFNPVKYKSRYEHYQNFAAHMSQSGVKLITVECIFESAPHFELPRQTFEITRADDRHHIQLVAPSIVWMKENLVNIAIKRLPRNIEYVAWLDADIEFERLDWPSLTIAELQRYPIVQLFELSFFLGPNGKKDILRRDYSFGYSIRHNKPINPKHFDGWYAHPGYAWGMRRSAFDTIGGLIDFCIIGSGDLHFAFALLHRIEETIRPGLHPDYRKLAVMWGDRVAQLAQNGANVGYVPVNLWHHWHGERNDRFYVDRWAILEKHKFSPLNDLEKNDDTGLLRLADKTRFGQPESVAHIEALERDIVAYFKSRNEDNNIKGIPVQHPPHKAKPFVATRTQTHRGGAIKSTTFAPSKSGGGIRPYMWTSGASGTHVDDDNPYLDQCVCPGHHHHPDNHECPCSPNHMDDQHCWNPSEHNDHHEHHHDDHHHNQNEHHHDYHPETYLPSDEHHHTNDHSEEHHHTNDHSGGHHSSHDHGHHTDGGHSGDSGHNHDHSSGSGGFHNTDYGGPGSFY